MHGFAGESGAHHWQESLPLWLTWAFANVLGGAAGGAVVGAWPRVGDVLFVGLAGVAQWFVLRAYCGVSPLWVPATVLGGLLGWWLGLLGGGTAAVIGFSLASAVLLLASLVGVQPAGSPVGTVLALVVLPGSIWAGGALGGALVGGLQSLVLQRHVGSTRWWLTASSAGGAVASFPAGLDLFTRVWESRFPLVLGTETPLVGSASYSPSSAVISGVIFGLLYGAVTGIALVKLLRQQPAALAPV